MEHGKTVLMAASVPSMIGQFNMENIRILKEMGYRVHVACNFQDRSVWTKEKTAQFQRRLYENGVACIQVECSRNPFALMRHIRSCRRLAAAMERERYAFVHCHTPITGALARLAAARTGTKAMYTAHGFHFYRSGPLRNWLIYYPVEKLLSRVTELLVTMNREDFQLAKKRLHAKRTAYIPGVGVDTARFSGAGQPTVRQNGQEPREELRRQLGLSMEHMVLLSVGELSRRKNHRLVLEAISRMQGAQIRYVICGIGEQEQALVHEAERLGISDQVIFAGYRTDVDAYYRMADLFVFPSLQEGLPVALMEAMASGLPCLASDIRGNRDLLHPVADTCLFPLKEPEVFLEKMETLLANPLLRERVRRENLEEIKKYDRERVNRQMQQLYASMDRSMEGLSDRKHGRACE